MACFLTAGFVFHLLGAENDPFLLAIADTGVRLLLFTTGLKLRLKTLLRPERIVDGWDEGIHGNL